MRNDLGGAYKLQNVKCDLTIVMATEAVEAFRRLGAPANQLRLVNPLVRPEFSGNSYRSEKMAADDGVFRILLSSGGEGLGNAGKAVRIILREAERCHREIEIDILVGRNSGLKSTLERTIDDQRVTVHGYLNDVHLLMRKADLVVGKCGANYTMETIMMQRPFLITQVGAPSEKPNMRYVLERGYGWYARSFLSLRRTLRRIFSDPREMRSRIENLAGLPQKNGAEEIAELIIAEIETTAGASDRPRH